MAVGSPPTVRRRQLGRELRKLRDEAGLHLDQLAERLRCSPSRISRIETARIRISPGTVHEILDALDIHDGRRERLVALAREADEPGWWQQFGDALSYEYATFIAMEAEAVAMRGYEPIVLHGLLQTEEYARAVIEKGMPGLEQDVDAKVAARMARQAVLTRPSPLRLWVLLGEAVLHRRVGSRVVMRGQLRRLVELADLPNVRLQVIPFEAGALVSMLGAFSIFEFDQAQDRPVVYFEHLVGDLYVENPPGVRQCGLVFDGLVADALTPGRSVTLIRDAERTI